MKKEDKVSRLKKRKRAREKRQRWRKRQAKRIEKLMAPREITPQDGVELVLRHKVAGVIQAGVLAFEPAPGTVIVVPKHGKVGLWAWLKEFFVRIFRRGD